MLSEVCCLCYITPTPVLRSIISHQDNKIRNEDKEMKIANYLSSLLSTPGCHLQHWPVILQIVFIMYFASGSER